MKESTTARDEQHCDIRRRPADGWNPDEGKVGELTVQLGSVRIEHGSRYLLTVNSDGTPNVREIPHDAAIASQARYLQMMMEPNGCYVPTDVLQEFVDAAVAKLAARRAAEGRRMEREGAAVQ